MNELISRVKILVVDDHPLIQSMLIQILKQLGFTNILLAGDGREALALIQGKEVQMVITDLNMPVLDGIGLLKGIRRHPEFTDLAVIVISADGEAQKVAAAMKAGADAFIVKPFTAKTVK